MSKSGKVEQQQHQTDSGTPTGSRDEQFFDDLNRNPLSDFDFLRSPPQATAKLKDLPNFEEIFQQQPKQNADNDEASNRVRKCLREKQRRAELNSAFSQLSKCLGLSGRTEKTVLIKSADQTITKLRDQVSRLQHQVTLAAVYPNQKHLLPSYEFPEHNHSLGQEHIQQPIQAPPAKKIKLHNSPVPILPKPVTESVKQPDDALLEMKKLVNRVESLYRMQIEKTQQQERGDEEPVTFSQCA